VKPLQEQTLYEILEVPIDAPEAEIVKAWDRVNALYGPSSLATYTLMAPDEAELLGRRLDEAITVLLDPEERKRYDARITGSGTPAPLAGRGEDGTAQRAPPPPAPVQAHPDPVRKLPPIIPPRPVAVVSLPATAPSPHPAAAPSAPELATRAMPPASPTSDPGAAPPDPRPRGGGRGELAPAVPASPAPSSASSIPIPAPLPAAPAPVLLLSTPIDEPAPIPLATPVPVSPPFAAVELKPTSTPAPVASAAPAHVPVPVPTPAPLPRHVTQEFLIPPGARFSGELLRRAREARGLTVAQICERTKVIRHHIENLETDRYDKLPAPVYLRGILMALAKELRLDGQKVAQSYLEAMRGAAPPPPSTTRR
jgi:hypothetical protein